MFDDLMTSQCATQSKMQKEHSDVVISYKRQIQQASNNAEEMNEFTFESVNEVHQAQHSEKPLKMWQRLSKKKPVT